MCCSTHSLSHSYIIIIIIIITIIIIIIIAIIIIAIIIITKHLVEWAPEVDFQIETHKGITTVKGSST